MTNTREQLLRYKTYHGSIEVSLKDERLFGRVQFVRDVVAYDGQTVQELQSAFVKAVDGYLAFCEEVGDEPDRPFSGSFNVRIGGELHQKAAVRAERDGVSLNKFIEQTIREKVTAKPESVAHTNFATNNSESVSAMTKHGQQRVIRLEGTRTQVSQLTQRSNVRQGDVIPFPFKQIAG